MSTQKSLGYRLINFVGIFILGLIVYTVLFFLGFPQYCIHFVPGMDQRDSALGIYMLGIDAYLRFLPFWIVPLLWYYFFKWCDREPTRPPTNPK